MFEFFSPVFLAIPVFIFGVMPAVTQFFILPLNLLEIQNLNYPLLHVFGASVTVVFIVASLFFLVRKEYIVIFPTLCIGFALSALYTALPLLLDLERDISIDGLTVLAIPAIFVFVVAAGLSLLASKSERLKITTTIIMIIGIAGYLLFSYAG